MSKTSELNMETLKRMSNAIRVLAAEGVQKANSGHPGMPMGIADVATILFSKYLNIDVNKPDWPDRDRFVLSAGHGSMLIYALNYLLGYSDMNIESLKNFRQLHSNTPGSLVADASRIFERGGIFLYPEDKREKNKSGRLRLTYEANPISFLISQAGGKATNGSIDILNVEVNEIHQRVPFIFGSKEEVEIFLNTN